ncbi:hypothetical protein IAE16_08575 [Hydrogenobacter sp. T-2]|uniref:hypothetical protein n=1 Tax=Pampinifervens diazotrophicum TaxID=1632018 RepID=UPI002B25FB1B|nr:hypothetical protein [Hydrogenobacter sp. T-2]WPM31865.1 hypothetical protein IAE16_08575 [Hydrogenobacter sp. T-2]
MNIAEFYQKQCELIKDKRERRKLRMKLKREKVPVFYRLIPDDVKNYKKYIEPESVDFVITDPPYSKKYLYLYEILGELSAYALKEKGLCIVMTGQSYLPEVISLLSKKLYYQWTMAYLTPGGQSPYIWKVRCNSFWKPLLIFTKSKEYKYISFGDVVKTSVNNNDKRYHHWGQSVEGFYLLMDKFVFPGQVVLDPFVGGGASAISALLHGCSFIGMDVDEKCIKTTEARIKELIEEGIVCISS